MTEFELNNLPTSPSGRRMLSRISPIYDKSLYMKTFMQSTGIEWDELRGYVETLRQQHFIETVDWGIEYMERKYSIEPDPTLSLEERRARLGIKAYRKYPLNPAVLEAYARDNFGVNLYLDESDAGYIHMILNHGFDGLGKFVGWLVEEKPAHLALDGRFIFVDFIGTGGDWDFYSDKIIRDPYELIPKTDADKKKFPRLYAGLVDMKIGLRTIEPPKPEDFVQTVYAGLVNARVGNRTVELGRPKGFTQRLHVGQVVIRGGSRTINADLSDLPTYEELIENGIADLLIADAGLARPGRIQIPVEHFDEILKVPIYAGLVETRNGTREIGLARPPDQVIKLHAGLAQVKRGERLIGLETNHAVTRKNILHVGQVLFRTGSRTIGTSDDIKEITHRIRVRSEKQRVNVGQVLGRFGSRTIGAGNRTYSEAKLLKIHAGQILARTGSRIIMAEDERFDELVGDWLRLIFASDYGRRALTLANPRDDLERAEIKSVGDFAIDNELLLTRDGELVKRLIRAELIKLREEILF